MENLENLNARIVKVVDVFYRGNYTPLAQEAGIAHSSFGRVVKGGGDPSWSTVMKLCEALSKKVSCLWLLTGIGSMDSRVNFEEAKQMIEQGFVNKYNADKLAWIQEELEAKEGITKEQGRLIIILRQQIEFLEGQKELLLAENKRLMESRKH